MSYKIALGVDNKPVGVIRLSDGAFIPASDENREYKQYLLWLEQGNTPLDGGSNEQ